MYKSDIDLKENIKITGLYEVALEIGEYIISVSKEGFEDCEKPWKSNYGINKVELSLVPKIDEKSKARGMSAKSDKKNRPKSSVKNLTITLYDGVMNNSIPNAIIIVKMNKLARRIFKSEKINIHHKQRWRVHIFLGQYSRRKTNN